MCSNTHSQNGPGRKPYSKNPPRAPSWTSCGSLKSFQARSQSSHLNMGVCCLFVSINFVEEVLSKSTYVKVRQNTTTYSRRMSTCVAGRGSRTSDSTYVHVLRHTSTYIDVRQGIHRSTYFEVRPSSSTYIDESRRGIASDFGVTSQRNESKQTNAKLP